MFLCPSAVKSYQSLLDLHRSPAPAHGLPWAFCGACPIFMTASGGRKVWPQSWPVFLQCFFPLQQTNRIAMVSLNKRCDNILYVDVHCWAEFGQPCRARSNCQAGPCTTSMSMFLSIFIIDFIIMLLQFAPFSILLPPALSCSSPPDLCVA